jgi:hypothetical protein
LANAKNEKDCAQRAFDAKSRMMVRIDLILRIYHILGGFVWGGDDLTELLQKILFL